MAAGKTDEEIAMILAISRNTVDTHVTYARKLSVNRGVTAVVRAIMVGMIHP